MSSTIKLHPRICDICECVAEIPRKVIWNPTIEERVTFCTMECFEMYLHSTFYYSKKDSIKLNK
jgi:hypothetical protein